MPRPCMDCGDEISEKRLKVLPNTKICVNCQEERENNGQFKKHVMDVQPVTEHEDVSTLQTLVKGDDV